MSTKHLVYVAVFASLIAIGAQIRIPLGPVPLTFQVPAVLLGGLLLGPKLGAMSAFIYMLMGLSGLPVFAGGGGIGSVFSPTFGFIAGYIPAAWCAGFGRVHQVSALRSFSFTFAAVLLIFLSGLLYFMLAMNVFLDTPVNAAEAFKIAVLPFILKDLAVGMVTIIFAKTLVRRGLNIAI